MVLCYADGLLEKWICHGCIERRCREGFPELWTTDLTSDLYARIVPKILTWIETVDKEPRGDDGWTVRERAQAAKIDALLRQNRMWPSPDDRITRIYQRWSTTG